MGKYTPSTGGGGGTDLSDRVAAIETNMGGLKLQKITQADYDALTAAGTVDENTMYLIVDDTTA